MKGKEWVGSATLENTASKEALSSTASTAAKNTNTSGCPPPGAKMASAKVERMAVVAPVPSRTTRAPRPNTQAVR